MRSLIINEFRINKKSLIGSGAIVIVLYIIIVLLQILFQKAIPSNLLEIEVFISIGWLNFIYSIVLVFQIFAYNKKKNNCDLYYSLPLSKKDLFLSKYLYGIISLFILNLGMFLIGWVALIANNAYFDFFGVLMYFLFISFINITLFNVMTVVYNLANNVIDGILYLIIFFFICSISSILLPIYSSNSSSQFIPGFYAIGEYNNILNALAMKRLMITDRKILFQDLFDKSFICLVLQSLTIVLGYYYSKKDYAERSENVGFYHKILFPICYILLLKEIIKFLPVKDAITITIICAIGVYVIYMIFNRKFKIPKDEIITMGVSFFIIFIANYA